MVFVLSFMYYHCVGLISFDTARCPAFFQVSVMCLEVTTVSNVLD